MTILFKRGPPWYSGTMLALESEGVSKRTCSNPVHGPSVTRGNGFLAEVWMGVRSRMWLDGRNVAVDEWASTDPNGSPDECARMYFEGGMRYVLADRVCSVSFIFLCRRPV
ncbi:hypothetical protein E2C01_016783 [Portunus trituberculatus]|uniref:C-type lectin domain-containing protein n=1 Tax=Portunus trituberculatus TaxID=210409 RepID=A0A5B7DPZ9_PORTR|nr:hypothetical protein [Portunus trituberculatus]